MSDAPLPDTESIGGEEYPIEATDNSVRPEDGDQSGVSQEPVPDIEED